MSEHFLSVKVEGEEMRALLESVEIDESDSQASMASMVFGDSDMVLGDVLQEGLTVEIDVGAVETHAVVFRGLITGISVGFPGSGPARVRVQALDSLVLLGYTPRTKRWWNTTVRQIVSEIAASYALRPGDISPENDDALTPDRPLQQVEETDLAFLHRLAADRACRLFVDHPMGPDTLNFVPIQKLMTAEPLPQTLRFNDNVREFTASFEAFATAPSEALVTTDPATGDRVEIAADTATAADAAWTPDPERIARLGDAAAAIAPLVAKAAMKRAKLKDFWRVPARNAGAPARSSSDLSGTHGDRARRIGQTGYGRATGDMLLRPRKRVTLEGFGGRWSGPWYLAKVKHEVMVRQRNYLCSFVVTR